jgi:hypothetical protein
MPSKTGFPWTDAEIHAQVTSAVQAYWQTRTGQATRQQMAGVVDTGSRSEITGGTHLDTFTTIFCDLIRSAGFSEEEVRFRTKVELPGYYRPTKKWDVIVVRKGRLCAAIELKSHVGPSFGNNFNNRTEEAVGSSVDLRRAFQQGILGLHPPWLGWVILVEDTARSTRPVGITSPSFKPDPIFNNTSYEDRYRILCQRMILEQKYDAATLLLAKRSADGSYREPSAELGVSHFLHSLYGHLIGCTA